MRVAMTLLARDEADVVDSWLRYHLARGVDLVVATDHRSRDGTSEILREHARDGRVVVFREEAEALRQDEWTTRMSRLAATQYGAEWVIPSDADEFWWPREGTFAEVLEAVPHRFGVVRGLMRHFVLRPGDGAPLERLVLRARASTDLTSPYHGQVKVTHRAVADVRLGFGNHDAEGRDLRVLRDWFPFEVLHFPLRSIAQLESKFVARPSLGQHITRARGLLLGGALARFLAETLVDDEAAETGLRDGSLVRDTRLRDALRALDRTGLLPDPSPLTLGEDADLVLDAGVALDLDSAVLADRRCSELEHAVAVLEARGSLPRRLARWAGRRRRSAS
jgi:hypothetical protein